ncbi:MAG: indolepyruvate ferredoxin oxidoreductase family protein [Bryobacterales bacterium]|nr:indolepyruvate ferredoxin oxidoreductase family protein [Bryobacterales bacterium]
MPRDYSLDDKYVLEAGSAYMTGIQALVRLPLEQMRQDRRAGRRTGCFISGYEGSPLGGYDLALERIGGLLADHNVRFVPGLNEDIAATSVQGAQMLETLPEPKVEGVVGIWYGKGPGVDRSGDALRHANLAGASRFGGALALAGDDHVSKSSTIPHQSELSLYNLGIPVLAPGSPQEILDFGLYGIALSRYSGLWCALKLATDVCDGGGLVEFAPDRWPVIEPPSDGGERRMHPLLIVPVSLEAERDLYSTRLEAARRFARANGLNRIVARHLGDRIGIVASGKAYHDLRTALRNMALDDEALAQAGVRILKLGMTFPVEPEIVQEFLPRLETLLVVEEKRSFVELQLREMLYDSPQRPAIYGKRGPRGEELLPTHGELDAEILARALASFLIDAPGVAARLARLDAIESATSETSAQSPARRATYCSGCPHNRSTLLLEGQVAGGGIGCHGMAAGLAEAHRGIAWLAHMGSEGGHWIGMAPFSGQKHLFQNLGDGTYFHSGRQGVLAAAQSGANITFKILHNGVVAMTGGQDAAGSVGIPAMTRQLEADGIRKTVILTDDLAKYHDRSGLAKNVTLRPREHLEDVLRELEQQPGATVMLYDQMCAAEKRRRRSRGILPKPETRVMIHERVCEGCGDCVRQSNCVSLQPVETEYGPKTRIHQSSCNVDASCILGECPSFVTVSIEPGSGLKRRPLPQLPETAAPAPPKREWAEPYHILMPGIGGTGVVTINALLATAATIDGLHATTLDQTGLAQKGGAVVAHLTLSRSPLETANRVSYGAADLLLGFDVVGAASPKNLVRASDDRTVAVVNLHQTPTGDSVRQGLTVLSPESEFRRRINRFTRAEENVFLDASRIVERVFGSHLQTNIFLLGVAWQKGLIPVSLEALEQAVRLNGVAVEGNLKAFLWGRLFAEQPNEVLRHVEAERPEQAMTLEELIEDRVRELRLYQDEAYAQRYRARVERVRDAERQAAKGEALTRAVAENLYKLMAYKDEYEVARLLSDPEFERRVSETFERPRGVAYHLHPPLLRHFGVKRKIKLGAWAKPLLRLLASFKALRGTAYDPFRRMASRRLERELVPWYEDLVDRLVQSLSATTLADAVELAQAPQQIRGYEAVKEEAAAKVRAWVDERLRSRSQRTAA